MLTKRIIPCLDVNNGRVVKGVNFVNLVDAGDPVEIAKAYSLSRADEIVFLDITASHENRDTIIDVVEKTAKNIFIPLTVGGGISSTLHIRNLLLAGADKVSLNSGAVKDPGLINRSAKRFGSQCIVVAIDAKRCDDQWHLFIHGGRVDTGIDVIKWAKEVERRGAGEILLTCMDRDGTKAGFDIELTKAVTKAVNIPVIASGGAGKKEDFTDIFNKGMADAALAASIFHFNEIKIQELKKYMSMKGIPVRL